MAFNPPSLSDAPDPGGVVGAVTDAAHDGGDAAAGAVGAVVDAVTDAAPPPPDGATFSTDAPDVGQGVDLSGVHVRAGGASLDLDVDPTLPTVTESGAVRMGADVSFDASVPGVVLDGDVPSGPVVAPTMDAGPFSDGASVATAGSASVTVDPGEAGEAIAGAAAAAAAGAAATAGDVLEDVRDTDVGVDAGGTARAGDTDGGGLAMDLDAHLGVEVDGNEVGVTTHFHDERDADGSTHGDADTGGFVDAGGHHNEAGVTMGSDQSELDGTKDSKLGVYAEHDDDRVEAGGFQTTDSDVGPLGHDGNRLTETGFYASKNDDEVRVGTTDDKGTAGEMATSGVFVEDSDGDRTGVGFISDGKASGDTFEVGTGGVYVDVDGERHDAHAEGGIVMADGEVELEGEVDPGPVSFSGRVGVVTEGPDAGTAYARGEETTETDRAGDAAADSARDVLGDINDDFGDLPHIDGLDDPDMDLPDLPVDDPTAGGPSIDDLDPPVIVHDALGDPVDASIEAYDDTLAATDPVDDPSEITNEADGNVLDSVTSAVGDAIGAVGDAVGNVFEDLFD